MKNLDQIKEEYATSLNDDYGTYTWQSLISGNGTRNMEHHHDAVAKLYAKEVATETLKNASDNANIEEYDVSRREKYICKNGRYSYSGDESEVRVYVNKQSILNETNIPKL